MTTYDVGDVVRLTAHFQDYALADVDPTTVTVKVKRPNGTTDTYTYPAQISRSSAGHYSIDIEPNATGLWHIRWESTGTAKAAEESEFVVRQSEF